MKKSNINIRLQKGATSGELKAKADAGDADAAFDWAWCLEKGLGTDENVQEAVKYYLMAAEQGDKHALANAASLMFNEEGISDKSIRMMQEAAHHGIAHAAYNLFIIHKDTQPRKAMHYLKQAAQGNNENALYELGLRTIAGHGVRKSEEAGISLIKKAAKQGYANALYYLAEISYHESPEDAFKHYRKAALAGHVVAMYDLAVCYRTGHGTNKNQRQEQRWLQKAAEHGHLYSMCDLAACYSCKPNTPHHDEQYRYWMHRAAEHGDTLAMQNLGYYYWPDFRKADNTDIIKAIEWFTKAANEGNAKALYELGRIYEQSAYLTHDEVKAYQCYRQASENGYPEAAISLGRCYLVGKGTEQNTSLAVKAIEQAVHNGFAHAALDLYEYCYEEEHEDSRIYRKKALKLLQKAAEHQNAEAHYNLAACYGAGNGVKKSDEKCFEHTRKAAELGFLLACNDMGVYYQRGQCVEQDYVKAAEYYRLVAQNGIGVAQYNLACLYDNGNGVKQDSQQAFYWFKESADNGFTESSYEVAVRYRDGIGTDKNAKQAFRYMQAAADDEFTPAYCNLGGMYKVGFGTRKNYKKALYYLEKSHMCAYAMAQLGCMLLQGLGTAVNILRAIDYLQQAAKKNEPHALYHLAQCYEHGWGVDKNTKKAARLYKKAAKHKPDNCPDTTLHCLCNLP